MTADPFRLDGQRVLISGAGGGIGSSLVARFTAAGATVVGADRDTAALAHLDLAERVAFDLADSAGTASRHQGLPRSAPVCPTSSSRTPASPAPRTLDLASISPPGSPSSPINLNGVYAMTAQRSST